MNTIYLRTNDYRLGSIAENGELQWPSVDIFHQGFQRHQASVQYLYVGEARRFVVLPPGTAHDEFTIEVNDNPPTSEAFLSKAIIEYESLSAPSDTDTLVVNATPMPEFSDGEPKEASKKSGKRKS